MSAGAGRAALCFSCVTSQCRLRLTEALHITRGDSERGACPRDDGPWALSTRRGLSLKSCLYMVEFNIISCSTGSLNPVLTSSLPKPGRGKMHILFVASGLKQCYVEVLPSTPSLLGPLGNYSCPIRFSSAPPHW